MPIFLWCLLGFATQTALLALSVSVARALQVLRGRARANEFPSGVPHGGATYWRMNRAHVNCAENLPLFAALTLTAAFTQTPAHTIDFFAQIYVLARVAQSLIHISSGSSFAVQVRFSCFLTQMACLAGIGATIGAHVFS